MQPVAQRYPAHISPPPPPPPADPHSPVGDRVTSCSHNYWPFSRDAAKEPSNASEQRIEALRKLAWRGDFFAQIELADVYHASNSLDAPYRDHIEEAVWLTMALSNPEGFEKMGSYEDLVESCRHASSRRAKEHLRDLMEKMSGEEIDKVRDRVTYILDCRGPKGLIILGRVYDRRFGDFGQPDRQKTPGASPFQQSNVDAWMFYYLAAREGDPIAQLYQNDFDATVGEMEKFAADKAMRWVSPLEIYPSDGESSALPLSDECCDCFEGSNESLDRIDREVPGRVKEHALRALGFLGRTGNFHDAVRRLQIALRDRFEDGRFSPRLQLRAVQLAAVAGSADAQTALGVMYAKGVGVCRGQSYARAAYWFRRAAAQGSAPAIYALSRYYDEGVDGIAPQNLDRSVTLAVASAQAGFWPTRAELATLLAQGGKEAREP
ncbi:MAG: sel1 repeat family protein [Alphaproteobacteria bacterium]|nr:sel1 repeat family protein [Alphaproteobacteria bacterium]